MYLDAFSFGTAPAAPAVRVARIAAGVDSVPALFDTLAAQLSFPDYFGANWNALAECLRDLEWLPPGRVVLLHEAMPAIDAVNLGLYIEVLAWSVQKWRSHPERSLEVQFPADSADLVARLLLR